MVSGLLLLAVLGWATGSECETTYRGECHNVISGCPSGFSQHIYSHCNFDQLCCYHSPDDDTPSSPSDCGIVVVPHRRRIVGGALAKASEYPWQVSLMYRGHHHCGGTLIDSRNVLSAAHCFENHREVTMISGPKGHWDLTCDCHLPVPVSALNSTYSSSWTVGVGAVDRAYMTHSRWRAVSRVLMHSGFNNETYADDIALVVLKTPVDVTGADVRPICLPQADDNFDNRMCTVTGWGDTHTDGDIERYLLEADIPVMTNKLCKYYLGPKDFIASKQLCAGFTQGGKDTCQGDSGGPLACKTGKVWKLAGIVSWGYDCGLRNSPGVYTRVTQYLGWINSNKEQ